jgi:membrane protease YdiL (CAAX protease family)
LISGILVAVVYLAIWAIRALIAGRLFPPMQERPVPWTGWQLIILVLLVQLFWPTIIYWTIHQSGLLESDSSQSDPLGRDRANLWVSFATFPFQIASIILLLVGVSRARLADMGLTTRYFGRNLLLALLGWLLLAPAVLLLNLIINLLYRFLFQVHEEEHPMMRLMISGPSTFELVLVVITAILAAPILEELLFRGVLQPWFAGRQQRGLIALVAALALATFSRSSKIFDALSNRGIMAALQEGMAIGFVLLMIPGYFLARELGRVLFVNLTSTYSSDPAPQDAWLQEGITTSPGHVSDESLVTQSIDAEQLAHSREKNAMNQAGAIYATSLLFAAAHSFAWPTPISLFVLALGLGFLVYRTQSIVGSITLHALFNSIAVVILLIAPQTLKGKDSTTAVPTRLSVVHCSKVPGS